MARLDLGQFPASGNYSTKVYRFGSRVRKNEFPTSRRRPYGAYSILGVLPHCTPKEIKKAYAKRIAECKIDGRNKSTSQAYSAWTKKLGELTGAKNLLADEEHRANYDRDVLHLTSKDSSNSSRRVRKHRNQLKKIEKKSVSAITVCRKRLDNIRLGALRRGPRGFKNASKRKTLRINKNNHYTRSGWRLLQRDDTERARDKRLSKWVVVTAEEKLHV